MSELDLTNEKEKKKFKNRRRLKNPWIKRLSAEETGVWCSGGGGSQILEIPPSDWNPFLKRDFFNWLFKFLA